MDRKETRLPLYEIVVRRGSEYEVRITPDPSGHYGCEIRWKDGSVEDYAWGDFKGELGELAAEVVKYADGKVVDDGERKFRVNWPYSKYISALSEDDRDEMGIERCEDGSYLVPEDSVERLNRLGVSL